MSFIQQFFTSRDNNANAETFVGQEGRLWWDPITNQIYSSDGNTPGGIPLAGGGGGNGSPGGSNSQVQFNQNGSFGGSVNLTFNSATGALTAVSFVGDGSALTNLTGTNVVGEVSYAAVANSVAGANVTGTVANATYADSAGTATTATYADSAGTATTATTATSATTAGTVTTAAQPNITSVGTLTSVTTTGNLTGVGLYVGGNGVVTGNLQVQGNLTYNNITNLTTANLVLGLANTSIGVSANGAGIVIGNTNEASFLYNYGTQQWNSNIGISAAGNVIGANINTPGVVSSTGNIIGGNLNTAGIVSATSNITGGNIRTAGVVSATGNVTGSYILGNGSQLTGIVSSYGNSNVTLLLAAGVGTNISTTGTVVAGNLNVTTAGNNLSVGHVQIFVANNTITTDNGSAVQVGVRLNTGNIFATGLVSGTGNVSGGNLTTPGQVSAAGNITTLGNISGNFYIGNGSLLTGITGTYGNTNVAAYLASGTDTSNIITTGNISGTYFIGNGSLLTGIATSSYGNSNVAAYLPTYTGNLVALTGNVTTTANVSGAYILGNGSGLTSITGANVTGTVASATTATSATTAGTVTTAAQPNITSVGTLSSLTVTGNTTSGNLVTQGNVAGPSSYNQPKFIQPNANDPNWAYGIYTDGASAFWMQSQFFGLNQTTRGFRVLEAEGNTVVFSVNGAGLVSAPGNVQGGNLLTGGLVSATGNITAAGNITGNFYIGNGSLLTGIVATSSYGNTNVAAYLASGTNSSNISTTGNVIGNYILGNGSQLNVGLATYVTANAQANITSVGTLTVANVSGELQLGNFSGNRFRILQDSGALYIQGGNGIASSGASVIFAPWLNSLANATMVVDIPNRKVAIAKASPSVELDVAGAAAVSGNITGGNLLTGGVISATGNITGNYILGNGSQLTGIVSSYGNANVVANLAALGSNPVSTTGNVTAGYFIGNGSLLTSLTGSNVTGQVSNALVAGTVYTAAQPNITSVGTLTSVTVTANTTSGNLLTGGLISATGNITSAANIAGGNIIGTLVGNLSGTTASMTGNVTGGNVNSAGVLSVTGRTFIASGNAAAQGISFSGDAGQDSGFYLISDGNIGVATNAVLRASFFDQGFSVVSNITGGNISTANTLTGGTIAATTLLSSTGNVIAANVRTAGLVTATGNVTAGNIVTGGLVTATGNVNSNNIIAVGTVSATGATNGTAFAVGNSAVSNVALGLFPTAGTPGEFAIRDYSTVTTNMYFDVGVGGTANGQFTFRTTNSYSTLANVNIYGITLTTNRPAFRVTGAGTTNNLTTTQNSTGALNGNNWAADYTQGSGLNSTTGVFTAPVAGLYQINAVGRNSGYAGGISQLAVVKNATGGTGSGGTVQLMIEWAASSSMNHVGSGTVARLAVNDTLALKVLAGQINFDGNDNWSVVYLG